MGWLIAIGILLLIAILPIGVSFVYCADGAHCSILFGLIKIRLFPRKNKDNHKNTDKKKTDGKKHPKKESQKQKGNWKDFIPLVRIGVDFLGSFRRKIRVKRLELSVVLAGDDPCDLALNYGRSWAGVGILMPLLERVFVIKKRDIDIQCDFLADDTKVSACLEVTITLGRAIGLVAKYGFRALREYFKITKIKKGGADL